MTTWLRPGWLRCVLGGAAALGGVFVLGELLKVASPLIGLEGAMAQQVALKTLIVGAAVVVWAATRRPWGEMGWRKITWRRGVWPWALVGCAAMAMASMLMILLGNRHPGLGQMTFVQIVLSVWVVSSVGEEIYVRGAVQSWCEGGATPEPMRVLTPPIVTSAVLFASMHVPLMWMGAGVAGGGILVGATLVVGWSCAVLRARTGSLWAAIGLHILANIAAVPGGIVGVVVYRIVHGELPRMG